MGEKRWWLCLAAVLAWLCFDCQPSLGSGFVLNEAGARSSSLAGTVVARGGDLSAFYYNPATLTGMPGLQVMAGGTFIIPSVEIVTHTGAVAATNSIKDNLFFPPHFYLSYQALDRVWVGLGFYSPFGLGTEFNQGWPGRFNNIATFITTFDINPTVAVKITDWLSGGIGLDIMYFSLKMQRVLPIPIIGNQETTLRGDSFGVGFNVGFQAKPLDCLALGVSYRSQVRQDVGGSAIFSPANSLNSTASGTILLPDEIFTGVMYQPIKPLSLEVGLVWTNWSLFKKLDIKFDNALGTLSEPKTWHNTLRPQMGVEYKALSWLDLRFGYAYDQEPVPDKYADYIVPVVGDRHTFGFGAGFRWQAFTFDLSYNYIFLPDKTVHGSRSVGVLPSDYQERDVHLVGLSLSYKF